MPWTKTRYVTICQQFLVTGTVSAVALTAAGVMTLDIVSPHAAAPQVARGADMVPAVRVDRGLVATRPVTPKVREVAVHETTAAPKREHAARPTVAGKRLAVQTPAEDVHGYATVGVTWKSGVDLGENQIAVQLRTFKDGRWSDWQKAAYHDDHGPDAASTEGRKIRPGTDAVVIGDVDKVQMRAETPSGVAPADMKLAVIDPGTTTEKLEAPAIDTAKLPASDAKATGAPVESTGPDTTDSAGADAATLSAMTVAPKPKIYSRAQWGANESIREPGLPDYGTIKTGFIHHTVNANNYTQSQVPALLRGIYAYHVESRGWRDIGYNFLVDRFGRIWEGRYGGVDRAVVGAHTLGYNEVSFAMSAIGNFDIARPPQAVLNAYASLFAWKLSMYDIRASATHLWVKNRYLNAINGHRDVGQTACPGRYLYAKIPDIRVAAQKIQDAAQNQAPPPPTFSPTQAPLPAVAQPSSIYFPHSANLTGAAYPDLTMVDGDGRVHILPTGGQIGWNAPVRTGGNWNDMAFVAAVGDVTGDGHGDVLARRPGGYARVYAGTGTGTVNTTGIHATRAFANSDLAIGAGDWNGDGHTDVISRDTTNDYLYLHPGTGKGTFGARTLLASNWPNVKALAMPGDINGDGLPDLVGQGRNSYLYVAYGRANHTLGTPAKRRNIAGYDTLIGSGDLTGDGIADVLLRSSTSKLTYLLPGTTSHNFGHALGPYLRLAPLHLLSAGQMAGNARADAVGVNPHGHLVVVAHNGRANTLAPITTNITAKTATQVLDVGDWDRDGFGDLITRDRDGDRLVLRPGRGGGRFGYSIVLGSGWKSITNLAAVGDVTGDRKPDLVGKTASGVMTIFPGNGKAGFTRPVRASTLLKTYNQIGSGSWNTGAFPASAVPSSDGSFLPFAASTDSTTSMRRSGADAGAYDWVIGIGDLDHNGRPDALAHERATGILWLLPGGSTGFGARRFIAEGLTGYRLLG